MVMVATPFQNIMIMRMVVGVRSPSPNTLFRSKSNNVRCNTFNYLFDKKK